MLKTFMVLFLLSGAALASQSPIPVPHVSEGEFAVFNGTKYKIFKVFEAEGLSLSSDCKVSTGKMKCQAFEASGKSIADVHFSDGRVTPASQLCSQLSGKNLIAFNSKKEEHNYCEFADGSLVNSWTLFYKYFPKNTIK